MERMNKEEEKKMTKENEKRMTKEEMKHLVGGFQEAEKKHQNDMWK